MKITDYTIYAVDFDGTLCENAWPGIGEPNHLLIRSLISLRLRGDKLILWTCRTGDKLNEAIEWCKTQGLEFDAINENLPEIIAAFDGESRKIFANVYIDDLAVNPTYNPPKKRSKRDVMRRNTALNAARRKRFGMNEKENEND